MAVITKVSSLNRKSFVDYTGPTDDFKLKNVIFGYNGRGKSSLSFGLRREFISEDNTNEKKLRYFDKDYVDDNLRLTDPETGEKSNSRINGVVAHFSAKDVKSEEKIKGLEEKILNIEPIQTRIEELKSNVRDAIDSIHDRRKGTANIAKKNKEFEVSRVIDLYRQDLSEAKKIEADEEKLSKIQGDNLIGEKIELLKTLSFSNFTKISQEDIEAAQDIFAKTFDKITIPPAEIVDWINTGIGLHEEGDNCKFCGNKPDLQSIEKLVGEYNANEKQKAVLSLRRLDEKMAELQNTIKANLDNEATVKSSLDSDSKIDNSYQFIKEASRGIANSRGVVQTKIKNIDKKITFDNFKGELQKFNDAIDRLRETKNDQLAKLESQNNSKDALVKGAIGLEIMNDKGIQKTLADIETKTQELDSATKSNTKINGQIQRLKQSQSATSDFSEYISEILTNLSINLKLLVSDDGKNYIIQHTQTSTPLTISDISEGERNLLALLFFYYELFNDNDQQDLKSNIELIVVDDPISSMDDINKMYILELMKQLLDLDSVQVFVLTHSWDDFTNLCYGYTDKPATPTNPATPHGFYEIKKDSEGNSFVQKTKSNITPYNHNFIEVFEFSQKEDTTNLDDCEIYHIPNIMRQVLEGFLKFKVRDHNPTKSNEKSIAKVLFQKEWAVIKEDKKTKLGQLLATINVNSHGSSRSPDEILVSAKFLMTRIKHVDEQHYNTHKEPLGTGV